MIKMAFYKKNQVIACHFSAKQRGRLGERKRQDECDEK